MHLVVVMGPLEDFEAMHMTEGGCHSRQQLVAGGGDVVVASRQMRTKIADEAMKMMMMLDHVVRVSQSVSVLGR